MQASDGCVKEKAIGDATAGPSTETPKPGTVALPEFNVEKERGGRRASNLMAEVGNWRLRAGELNGGRGSSQIKEEGVRTNEPYTILGGMRAT